MWLSILRIILFDMSIDRAICLGLLTLISLSLITTLWMRCAMCVCLPFIGLIMVRPLSPDLVVINKLWFDQRWMLIIPFHCHPLQSVIVGWCGLTDWMGDANDIDVILKYVSFRFNCKCCVGLDGNVYIIKWAKEKKPVLNTLNSSWMLIYSWASLNECRRKEKNNNNNIGTQ